MKGMKWLLLLLAGWSTLVGGLFLATLTGNVAEQWFGLARNSRLWVQAVVMSGLVVPIMLYLYQHVYRMTGLKPKTPEYSWKKLTHFITGVLLALALVSFGFIIARTQGWIVIEEWHAPDQWLAALFVNIVIAFLYEAFPEELGLRGMLYDVLRHRFSTWLSLILQTLLFVAVTTAVALLQALVGLTPGVSIAVPYILFILCFGLCLQLLRLWTRNLWTTIGFHLAYLEITRFVIVPHQYGAPPIITYHESEPGLAWLISAGMIIVGGVIVSLIILGAKRFMRRREVMRSDSLS
ncbi:CPBP family intramembrane glutamic endopeptidase [Paenibacillus sp. 481]|uniref:CPBP family intramembrane glutamic endopeptidase n=1 Tax=Paenibacillus sp. 481 TaxID=2835869 RepID=UPI001E2C281A|nr:CPBP family intramembrane glutamic endopeptidase [Paenibacillus sp. 481]UHA73390.1 CPBP family intramembrane metalloprotease [Paenibacillus sp. 481]